VRAEDRDVERRRRTLYAALGFCRIAETSPRREATALRAWLSTWSGLGHVVVGMQRQGFSVTLRKLPDDGWNATFQKHALLAPEGFANAATPFDAVLRAAWSALTTRPVPTPGSEMIEEVP
jgi:hypothetical protein